MERGDLLRLLVRRPPPAGLLSQLGVTFKLSARDPRAYPNPSGHGLGMMTQLHLRRGRALGFLPNSRASVRPLRYLLIHESFAAIATWVPGDGTSLVLCAGILKTFCN